MKVADESQALRLVIQTQQDGRRRSPSPVTCGSDQKEEQGGRRRTPSPVACGSDQKEEQDGHRRTPSPAACDSDQRTVQKVADEPQAQWLVIQTRDKTEGRRRTPSSVACGSDQQHRRPSPVARGPDAGTTKGLITTWLPAAALDKI